MNIFQNLLDNLQKWNVIVALVLLAIAMLTVFLSKTIADAIGKEDKQKDSLSIVIKIIALGIAVVGVIFVIIV